MKIKRFLSVILLIACLAALCVPASALTEGSYQIAVYGMDVTPNPGVFDIYFSVTGPGYVDKLGCESIYLYKLVDLDWVPVTSQTKLEDDSGMSKNDAYICTNVVQCSCVRGVAYKIEVTIFSENSYGRDTRSQVFYRIGQ